MSVWVFGSSLWQLLQVDNYGTVNLVEACRKVGVNRFILVSSILVNGAAMGQLLNPAYIVLNVFGLTLVAKLQAEQHIRKSGINYTIIRPGGLRNDPPKGNIVMEPEVFMCTLGLWTCNPPPPLHFNFSLSWFSCHLFSLYRVCVCVGYPVWRLHFKRPGGRGGSWGVASSRVIFQSSGNSCSNWSSKTVFWGTVRFHKGTMTYMLCLEFCNYYSSILWLSQFLKAVFILPVYALLTQPITYGGSYLLHADFKQLGM